MTYQLTAIGMSRGDGVASETDGWSGEFNGKRVVSTSVVKSSRPREISKRKAYFDFENFEGSVLAPRFYRANPGTKEMVDKRRELDEQLRSYRALGLGGRHPSVVSLSKKIEPLEEALVSRWKTFQAERGRR